MADDARGRTRWREAIVLAGVLAGMTSAALLKQAVGRYAGVERAAD